MYGFTLKKNPRWLIFIDCGGSFVEPEQIMPRIAFIRAGEKFPAAFFSGGFAIKAKRFTLFCRETKKMPTGVCGKGLTMTLFTLAEDEFKEESSYAKDFRPFTASFIGVVS